MELDLEGKHADRAYAMLVSLVTPRPIAWVTTLDENGAVNVAPFSFFNALGANPPIIGFAPGRPRRWSAKGHGAQHPSDPRICGQPRGRSNGGSDEPDFGVASLRGERTRQHAGLTTAASSVVAPPRIAEAPASLECKEWGTLEIGREPSHHRPGEAGAGARRINRSRQIADSERAFPRHRTHGEPELGLSHPRSLRDGAADLTG